MQQYSDILDTLILGKEPLNEFMFGPSTSVIQEHDVLNPKIWDNETRSLLPEIKDKLTAIVHEFTIFAKADVEIQDILLTGSNANYNYSPTSDLDLHLRIDMAQLPEIAKEFFTKARALWNEKRKITIRGIGVEIFVEDENTPKGTGGIYSLKHEKWIKPPVKFGLDRHDPEIKPMARIWIRRIKTALKSNDVNEMMACFKSIRDERRDGIESGGGEASATNLAFKVVRAAGWFDKLFKEIDRVRNSSLSMAESEELQEFYLYAPKVNVHPTLNPKLWDGDVLKEPIRQHLLKVAKAFMGFLGEQVHVIDIRFQGSMANYNYNDKSSDIDVHVMVDMKAMGPMDSMRFQKLVTHARVAWKAKYNITVMGFPVEMGVDDIHRKHASSAVYSLIYNEWVDKPTGERPDIDLRGVHELYLAWKKKLDRAMKTGNLKIIKKVEGEIRGKRDRALGASDKSSERWVREMSVQNLAFKRLRETGVFDRIKAMSSKEQTDKLSFNSTE